MWMCGDAARARVSAMEGALLQSTVKTWGILGGELSRSKGFEHMYCQDAQYLHMVLRKGEMNYLHRNVRLGSPYVARPVIGLGVNYSVRWSCLPGGVVARGHRWNFTSRDTWIQWSAFVEPPRLRSTLPEACTRTRDHASHKVPS